MFTKKNFATTGTERLNIDPVFGCKIEVYQAVANAFFVQVYDEAQEFLWETSVREPNTQEFVQIPLEFQQQKCIFFLKKGHTSLAIEVATARIWGFEEPIGASSQPPYPVFNKPAFTTNGTERLNIDPVVGYNIQVLQAHPTAFFVEVYDDIMELLGEIPVPSPNTEEFVRIPEKYLQQKCYFFLKKGNSSATLTVDKAVIWGWRHAMSASSQLLPPTDAPDVVPGSYEIPLLCSTASHLF